MEDYLVKSGEHPVLEVEVVNREIRIDDDVPDCHPVAIEIVKFDGYRVVIAGQDLAVRGST